MEQNSILCWDAASPTALGCRGPRGSEMRDRSWQRVLGWMVLSAVIALAGCAVRPDPPRASAVAPAMSTGSDAPYGERVASIRPAAVGVPEGQNGSATVGTRPPLKDYVAIPDLPDVHFEFDTYELRADARRILTKSAAWLVGHPSYVVLIEGHTDERGTHEYNMVLGERRASAAMSFLVAHGVAAGRFTIISYGEERSTCRYRTEACWAMNRRARFAVKAQ